MFALMTMIAAAAAFAMTAGSGAHGSFRLASDDVADGATLSPIFAYDRMGCPGKNASPELHWSGAPAKTASFALTMFDPDARPPRGWWHWVAYAIAAATTHLARGAAAAGIGSEGPNDFGTTGYGGPCPPPGDPPHHYVITIYALDATIGSPGMDGAALLQAMRGHVLAKAQLVGRFGR